MCAGAIDGTHIPFVSPSECHAEYVERKSYQSTMQAVVDCKYLYRDVAIRWPGNVHHARAFLNSSIFNQVKAIYFLTILLGATMSRNVTFHSSRSYLFPFAMGFKTFSEKRRSEKYECLTIALIEPG